MPQDGFNCACDLPLLPMNANAAMRVFDAQPRWMKELLWSSPIGNIACDDVARPQDREKMTQDLRAMEQRVALRTWGPHYPTEWAGPLPTTRRARRRLR